MGQADSLKYGPSDKHRRIFRFGPALNFTMWMKAAFVPFAANMREWLDFNSELVQLRYIPADFAVATPLTPCRPPKSLQHCPSIVVEITGDMRDLVRFHLRALRGE